MARKTRGTMTELLRQELRQTTETLSAIEAGSGLKRQVLRKFRDNEQSLRLDFADKLAAYFGIVCTLDAKRKGRV